MLGRFLKKYFIPHEGNDHRPHILRSGAFMGMLLAVLFVETLFVARSFFLFPSADFFASILPSVLVGDTNANRTADSLTPLQTNALLTEAAQLKANDMAAKDYFAHTSPTGITPWYWLDQVGYNYEYAGENLAVNFTDSQDVVNAWMNSPEHRANILDSNYTQIGIATAQGEYEGHSAVFVVQFFGRPAPAGMASAPIVPAVPVAAAAAAPTSVSAVSASAAAPAVAGAVTELPPAVTSGPAPLSVQIASAPHTFTNYFYIALMALIGLAFALYLVIKREGRHPQLVMNAVVLLLIITLALAVNNFVAVYQAAIL